MTPQFSVSSIYPNNLGILLNLLDLLWPVYPKNQKTGPSNTTFQRLMTHIFCEFIRIFLHVFFDDIFVFSDLIEEHEKHLEIVFQIVRDNHLFLNKEKCFLYAECIECLGHIIDEAGIHIGTDKMENIRNW